MKTMKLVAVIAMFVTACGTAENPADNPNNKKALAAVKAEPKVKDAVITEANVLYVAVDDDGNRRDGYAQYICELLRENKATTSWVKIVKRGSENDPNADNAFGILLGEAHCK